MAVLGIAKQPMRALAVAAAVAVASLGTMPDAHAQRHWSGGWGGWHGGGWNRGYWGWHRGCCWGWRGWGLGVGAAVAGAAIAGAVTAPYYYPPYGYPYGYGYGYPYYGYGYSPYYPYSNGY